MFCCAIYNLPSCNDYKGASVVYSRALSLYPKINGSWPKGTRPLDDYRKQHYAVIKDDDAYRFRLYKTDVVVWRGPTTCEIDIAYDSQSTHSFAWKYAPAGISFPKYKGQQCICTRDGVMNHSSRVTLELVGYDWRFSSPVTKPTRKVLNPDIRWRVEQELKPLLDYIRAIWAVSGNNGHHPWVGQPVVRSVEDETPFERDIKNALIRCANMKYGCYNTVSLDLIIGNIRKEQYKLANAYMQIDYDQPIPRRTKT